MVVQQESEPERLQMIRRELTEEDRIQLQEEIRLERESMYANARRAIAQFENLSPVEILHRSIAQRRAEVESRVTGRRSASSDESQNSNPSTVITSYPRTLQESPFSVEEPESQTEGETVGTITVTPIYSDYSNSAEHPNRTITITECTESVSTENDNDTSSRTSGPIFPPDDATPM